MSWNYHRLRHQIHRCEYFEYFKVLTVKTKKKVIREFNFWIKKSLVLKVFGLGREKDFPLKGLPLVLSKYLNSVNKKTKSYQTLFKPIYILKTILFIPLPILGFGILKVSRNIWICLDLITRKHWDLQFSSFKDDEGANFWHL